MASAAMRPPTAYADIALQDEGILTVPTDSWTEGQPALVLPYAVFVRDRDDLLAADGPNSAEETQWLRLRNWTPPEAYAVARLARQLNRPLQVIFSTTMNVSLQQWEQMHLTPLPRLLVEGRLRIIPLQATDFQLKLYASTRSMVESIRLRDHTSRTDLAFPLRDPEAVATHVRGRMQSPASNLKFGDSWTEVNIENGLDNEVDFAKFFGTSPEAYFLDYRPNAFSTGQSITVRMPSIWMTMLWADADDSPEELLAYAPYHILRQLAALNVSTTRIDSTGHAHARPVRWSVRKIATALGGYYYEDNVIEQINLAISSCPDIDEDDLDLPKVLQWFADCAQKNPRTLPNLAELPSVSRKDFRAWQACAKDDLMRTAIIGTEPRSALFGLEQFPSRPKRQTTHSSVAFMHLLTTLRKLRPERAVDAQAEQQTSVKEATTPPKATQTQTTGAQAEQQTLVKEAVTPPKATQTQTTGADTARLEAPVDVRTQKANQMFREDSPSPEGNSNLEHPTTTTSDLPPAAETTTIEPALDDTARQATEGSSNLDLPLTTETATVEPPPQPTANPPPTVFPPPTAARGRGSGTRGRGGGSRGRSRGGRVLGAAPERRSRRQLKLKIDDVIPQEAFKPDVTRRRPAPRTKTPQQSPQTAKDQEGSQDANGDVATTAPQAVQTDQASATADSHETRNDQRVDQLQEEPKAQQGQSGEIQQGHSEEGQENLETQQGRQGEVQQGQAVEGQEDHEALHVEDGQENQKVQQGQHGGVQQSQVEEAQQGQADEGQENQQAPQGQEVQELGEGEEHQLQDDQDAGKDRDSPGSEGQEDHLQDDDRMDLHAFVRPVARLWQVAQANWTAFHLSATVAREAGQHALRQIADLDRIAVNDGFTMPTPALVYGDEIWSQNELPGYTAALQAIPSHYPTTTPVLQAATRMIQRLEFQNAGDLIEDEDNIIPFGPAPPTPQPGLLPFAPSPATSYSPSPQEGRYSGQPTTGANAHPMLGSQGRLGTSDNQGIVTQGTFGLPQTSPPLVQRSGMPARLGSLFNPGTARPPHPGSGGGTFSFGVPHGGGTFSFGLPQFGTPAASGTGYTFMAPETTATDKSTAAQNIQPSLATQHIQAAPNIPSSSATQFSTPVASSTGYTFMPPETTATSKIDNKGTAAQDIQPSLATQHTQAAASPQDIQRTQFLRMPTVQAAKVPARAESDVAIALTTDTYVWQPCVVYEDQDKWNTVTLVDDQSVPRYDALGLVSLDCIPPPYTRLSDNMLGEVGNLGEDQLLSDNTIGHLWPCQLDSKACVRSNRKSSGPPAVMADDDGQAKVAVYQHSCILMGEGLFRLADPTQADQTTMPKGGVMYWANRDDTPFPGDNRKFTSGRSFVTHQKELRVKGVLKQGQRPAWMEPSETVFFRESVTHYATVIDHTAIPDHVVHSMLKHEGADGTTPALTHFIDTLHLQLQFDRQKDPSRNRWDKPAHKKNRVALRDMDYDYATEDADHYRRARGLGPAGIQGRFAALTAEQKADPSKCLHPLVQAALAGKQLFTTVARTTGLPAPGTTTLAPASSALPMSALPTPTDGFPLSANEIAAAGPATPATFPLSANDLAATGSSGNTAAAGGEIRTRGQRKRKQSDNAGDDTPSKATKKAKKDKAVPVKPVISIGLDG